MENRFNNVESTLPKNLLEEIKNIEKYLSDAQKKKLSDWLDKQICLIHLASFWNSDIQIKNLKDHLNVILNDLNLLDKYQLITDKEYIKALYKNQLNSLKNSILDLKNKYLLAPLYMLLINLIAKFKFEPTKDPVITFKLDKKWSLDDRKITLLNYLNYKVKAQLFILEKGLYDKLLILKLKNGALKKMNIENYKIYKTKHYLVIAFLKNNKYGLIINNKWKLYLLNFDNYFLGDIFSLFDKIKFAIIWFDDELVEKLFKSKIPKQEINLWTLNFSANKKYLVNKQNKVSNVIKKNISKVTSNTKHFEKNIYNHNQKLATKDVMERKKIVEEFLDSLEMKKYYTLVLKKLENKSVRVWTKKVVFTKQFIEKNKDKLISNLKNFILFIISVESDFNPLNKNNSSSAQGLAQWLVNNGSLKIDKKWHKYRWTSSWETTLNMIIKSYSKDKNYKKLIQSIIPVTHIISSKVTSNITEKTKSKLSKDKYPITLSWENQIKILALFLPLKWCKFFMLALLGNERWFKNYYKYIHHTKPDKDTLNRIKERFPIYKKELLTYLVDSNTWKNYIKYLAEK